MKSKKLFSFVLAFAACIVMQLTSLAADYRIAFSELSDSAVPGHVYALWDASAEKEDRTRYKVRLYRDNENNALGSYVTTGKMYYDFTDRILASGTGKYFVIVFPEAGGIGMSVASDIFEVTSETLKLMRDTKAAEVAKSKENYLNGVDDNGNPLPRGWNKNADGKWVYRMMDGHLMMSMWADIDGKTYYFANDGTMLTGWMRINRKWYYFGTDGALYRNTITPDGCQVDAEGAWIVDGAVVVDEAAQKNRKIDEANVTLIKEFKINLSENDAGRQKIKVPEFKNGKEAIISNVVYSKPYEEWKPGETVMIHVVYSAVSGCSFDDDVKFSCSRAVVKSNSGDKLTRTVILEYIPKVQLLTPGGVFLTEDGTIRWNKVEHAGQYNVKVMDEMTKSTVVNDKQTGLTYDLSRFLGQEGIIVKIYAIASKSESKFYLNSEAFVITDLLTEAPDYVVGNIERTSGNRFRLTDDYGEPVTNCWRELANNWYHFNKNGVTEAPGWFQDTDGRWYFFNDSCEMMVGIITDNGKQYFLNDGSYKDIPLGAWVEEIE